MTQNIDLLKNLLLNLKLAHAKQVVDTSYVGGLGSNFTKKVFYENEFREAMKDYSEEIECPEINAYVEEVIKNSKMLWNTEVFDIKVIRPIIKKCMRSLYVDSHLRVQSANPERTKDIIILENALNFLTKDNSDIFIRFEDLTKVLEKYGFKINDIIDVIVMFATKNVSQMEREDVNYYVPDEEAIAMHTFKNLSDAKRDRLVDTHLVNPFLNDDSKKDKKARKELRAFVEKHRVDVSSVANDSLLITRVVNRSDGFAGEYDSLTDSLNNLGLGKYVRKLITRLTREENKKISNDVEKEVVEENLVQGKVYEPIALTKKEINTISRELSSYFDFENMICIRELTLEEIIYVLAKLKYLNASEATIQKFLFIAEKEMRKCNPITFYYRYYDKIKFYLDNEEVRNIYEDIEDFLKVGYLFANERDYAEFKELLEDYLTQILNIIGSDYTYEMEQQKNIKLSI